jgi:hypothetical protein
LKDASFGPFCERPMEIALNRISTDWRVSQPPHLHHLAVVRDTAQKGKTAHYHFYTHDNFRKLVESGHAIWNDDEKPEKAKGWPASAFEVDEYGFPRIPDHRFQREGLATLRESALAVEARDLPYNKSTVVYFEREDGTFGLWTSSKNPCLLTNVSSQTSTGVVRANTDLAERNPSQSPQDPLKPLAGLENIPRGWSHINLKTRRRSKWHKQKQRLRG